MERIDLIFQYSPWFIPLCLLLGAGYAGILYYREQHNEFKPWVRSLLMVSRFLLVSFTAFLLLAPLIKKQSHQTEKPMVVIAQDFSASIGMAKDSTYYKNEYLDKLNQVALELEEDYQVNRLGFGEAVSPGLDKPFKQQFTDMGSLMDYVENTYENRNLAALIIASDGIVNTGADPYYKSKDLFFPIHTIALGDTTVKTDVRLSAIRNNDIAYKGNNFPLEVEVAANNASGQTATLRISKDGKVLEERKLMPDNNRWQKKLAFTFEAKETGMQEYRLSISKAEGEENLQNNSRRVFIEVLENKQRVLILGRRPHPDLAAIKRAIQNNPNYETKVEVLPEFNGKAHAFNLVIMHGLPIGGSKLDKILRQLKSNNVPVWFIPGADASVNMLNRFGRDISVQAGRNKAEEVKGVLNEQFTLFEAPDDNDGLLPALPPLQSLFGKFNAVDDSRVLAYRKIGNVTTSAPLWAFGTDAQQKYAVTFGEGLWRWRIYNYVKANNYKLVDELIQQTVKYLVVSEDKSRFRLKSDSRFSEYEKIQINAELYNQSYEAVNEPEVKLVISDEQGREYPYVMSRKGQAYQLVLKSMSPGTYSYKASTRLGSEIFDKSGLFVVEDVNLEAMNITADHHLLYRIAKENKGEMISPGELQNLPSMILASDVKPVVYTVKEYVEWIRLRWIVIILIGLLTLEWIMRKLNGAL